MNPLSQADAEQSVALVAVKKLLSSSHKDAANAAENGKFTIDFQITFDRASTQTNVRVVSRSCKSISEVIQTADPLSLPPDHAVTSGVEGIPHSVFCHSLEGVVVHGLVTTTGTAPTRHLSACATDVCNRS